MINGTESCKIVIAKIYRDLGLTDMNYFHDCVEWIGEALELIGAATSLNDKTVDIEVTSFKAVIPSDLIEIQRIWNEDNRVLTYNPHLKHEDYSEHGYYVNQDYIVTGFESGAIKVKYLGYPTDEDGYPLVPKNQYFREALFWYCFKHLILKGYKPKTDITYQIAEENWRRQCAAARSKANYPSIDQYERFKNSWVRMIPVDRFESGFDSNPKDAELPVITAANMVSYPEINIPD